MAAISGNLESFQLVKIFRSILDRKMSGVLTLRSDEQQRVAYFSSGVPFRVVSTDEDEQLGPYLVEEGLISSTELVELERDERVMGTPFERLLLDQSLVTKARIEVIEGSLTRRRLVAPFGWSDGTYHFEPSELRGDQGVIEPIDPVDLIIQAAAEALPTPLCERFLNSFRGQVLRQTEWLSRYTEAFDRFFPQPNLRMRLDETIEAPAIRDLPGDRARNLREGCALILSGLCTLQVHRGVKARAAAADPPPKPPERPTRSREVRMRASGPRRREGRRSTPAAPGASPASAKPRAAKKVKSDSKKPTHEMPVEIRERLESAVALAVDLKDKSHYEVLGVNTKASADAIRTAFRSLARDYHVDRFARFGLDKEALTSVQQVFIAVNRAQEVLSSPADRKEYDVRLEMEAQGHRVQEGGAGVQVDQAFRAEKLIRDGTALLYRGEAAAALVKLKKAIESQPDDPVARSGIAYGEFLIAQAQGGSRTMLARAKTVIEEIVAEVETRPEPFLYLGRLYRSMDDLEAAARAYKKALQANPHFSEAKSDLRHIARRQSQEGKGLLDNIFGRRKK